MRAVLAVLLSLWSVSTAAQPANDVEFEVTVARGAVTLTIPVDQLRFVDDGSELSAAFSIVSVDDGQITPITEQPRRITAPRGTIPQGDVTHRFELVTTRRAGTISIEVRDENSGRKGTRTISIDGGRVTVQPLADTAAADAAWRDALTRAAREKKPIVVFYRTSPCARCSEFERASVPHPTIQRRLPQVVFATLPAPVNTDPSVALFDRAGVLRARWPIIPDTTNFGVILDAVAAVAPYLERAVQRAEAGLPADGELEIGIALARLGFATDARAALARARENGTPETRQSAIMAGALLDAQQGHTAAALTALQQIAESALTPAIGAEAWLAMGRIHRTSGATDEAIDAFTKAAELVESTTPAHAAAQQALTALRAARKPAERGPIRILPLGRQLVSGRHTVRTSITSAAVARVTFSLDGREVRRIDHPPFSIAMDFGDVPQTRTIRAVAHDRQGRQIGRDERLVNEAGETFWLHLTAPREGPAAGNVRVAMNLRAPAAQQVKRVVLSWNDARRATLTSAPWEATIDVPDGQLGILRAVAELDDGRTAEDALLLNAGSAVGRADVQLVQLPITIISRTGATPPITAGSITVREGKTIRRVESIATAAETPLTIGLLLDVSDSMQATLPDVQEAAIRFLESTLGERDRAFLVTFDSRARLVQPPTSDVALLRRQIMTIRPNGLTALNDAMALGLLQFEGTKGRRALIVFSDGFDLTSQYTAAEIADLARRVSVPVHAIASIQGLPATLDA
ncbi:MAG: Ca-activated chloride channel, partial [Acidobacteriota bacterium]|nr:Ca-activated chloride channel [Acidobacteriota bacterium]